MAEHLLLEPRMHLAQQPDHLVRRVPLGPVGEADEIGEEDGDVLLAHLRERRVLARQPVDGRRREIAGEVAALALERGLPLDQLARARDDAGEQRSDNEEHHDVANEHVDVDEGRHREHGRERLRRF